MGELIEKLRKLAFDNPNDMEFGRKVRELIKTYDIPEKNRKNEAKNNSN